MKILKTKRSPLNNILNAISYLFIAGVLIYSSNTKASNNNGNSLNSGDSVDAILERYLQSYPVKGISVASFDSKTKTVNNWVAGVSHDDVPVNSSMLWGIGSNTKTFASVLLHKLAEKGLVKLDDEIGQYLPTNKNINPKITIKQLLQHQSGLAEVFDNPEFDKKVDDQGNRFWSPEEVLSYLPAPENLPGEKGRYTSTNYILTAMIIEKVSELPFHEALRKYITAPLQLKQTYAQGFETISETLVHPWNGNTDVYNIPRTSVLTSCSAAGCMVSSPENMVRWYNELFNENFLSAEYFREFTSFIPWSYDNYYQFVGSGIFKSIRNNRVYYAHGGYAFGYYSFTLFDIKTKKSIIAMTTGSFQAAEQLVYEVAEFLAKQ